MGFVPYYPNPPKRPPERLVPGKNKKSEKKKVKITLSRKQNYFEIILAFSVSITTSLLMVWLVLGL